MTLSNRVPAEAEECRSVTTRLIAFANSVVAISYQGDQAAALVNFLFGDLPVTNQPPQVTFQLQPDETSNDLILYREKVKLYQGLVTTMAERLLGYVGYELADHSHGGLLLHAAALTWQDRGVLLPATAGAGKSTLAAWLLSRGFTYLTDELAFVPAGSTSLHGFARPLSLKPSSRTVLALPPIGAEVTDLPLRFLRSPHLDLVSPILLGTPRRLSDAPLYLIIFPHYQPGATLTLQSLPKAQAGKIMLEHLLNAHNVPEHGFFEITRLVRHLPVYYMTYGHFDSLDRQLATLLTNPHSHAQSD